MKRAMSLVGFLSIVSFAADSRAMPIDGCNPDICDGVDCGVYHIAGCTIDCGSCPGGYTCQSHYCVASCSPTTNCAAQGMNCGTLWDGCNTISCGSCSAGWICDGANVCQPPPPPPPPDGEWLCDGSRAYINGDAPTIF